MIRRPPRSTQSRSSAASDVYKRQHNAGAAVCERPVYDVAVAGHPAYVRGAPPDIVVLHIEDPLVGEGHEEQVPRGRVEDSLGFAGTATRVEDEEGILGIHWFWRAVGFNVGCRHLLVPPTVAAFLHLYRSVRSPYHEDVLDAGALLEGRVGVLLKGYE